MTKILDKTLLSEILDKEVSDNIKISENIITYEVKNRVKKISTFEFQDLCFEWLYNTINCILSEKPHINLEVTISKNVNEVKKYNRILGTSKVGSYYCRVSELNNSGCYKTFFGDTKLEVVVKACNYLLEEIY